MWKKSFKIFQMIYQFNNIHEMNIKDLYLELIIQINQILPKGKQTMFSRQYNFGSLGNDITNMRDFSRNCNTLESFIEFTKTVVIDAEECSYTGLKTLLERQKIKVIVPLQKFCMRLIEQGKIFTQAHVIFVQYTLKFGCPEMALCVISSQAIPFKIQKDSQLSFYYNCFLVYYNLEMYEKGFKKLQEIITKFANGEYEKLQSMSQNIIYCATYLFMCRLLNYKNFRKQIMQSVVQGDLLSYNRTVQANQMSKRQLMQQLIQYGSGKEYSKVFIQNFIRNNQLPILASIYNQCQQKFIKMRQYVINQISDKQQRIKISDIKQNLLRNPQSMKQINKFKNLAKYDCREGILYFNHQKGTQVQINQLISRCFDLNEAIKKLHESDGAFKYKLRSSMFSLGGFSSKMGGMGMGMGRGRGYGLDDDDE